MWIFESAHCKIRFLDKVNAVHIKWLGFPASDEFKEACNRALDLMIEKKTSKFLTDNYEAVIFSRSDQIWLNEDWLVRAKKAGYRVSAVILNPNQGFTKLVVENIVDGRGEEFLVKTFQDESLAVSWLLSIE